MKRLKIYWLPVLLLLTACSSTYYGAMEKIGIHKREILVDRIEDAKISQQEAQQQFSSALAQLTSLTQFDGGELEASAKDAYDSSEDAASELSGRIDKIEDVAEALFNEWEVELGQYSSEKLKRDSRNKLRQTQLDYKQLLGAMHRAETRMGPVLAGLQGQHALPKA